MNSFQTQLSIISIPMLMIMFVRMILQVAIVGLTIEVEDIMNT